MLALKGIIIQACQILGLVWFLVGFFPRKATLSGFRSFDKLRSPFMTSSGAHFDKLIFVVVDALRSDFMFSAEDSLMPFLHSLIRDGNALPFTAFSHPPTVTLPRLKGLTTGGTPSFVDAILNIADDKDQSQGLEKVDSWISQFKNSRDGRKLHFFGDDTWLKLFPPHSFFERFEGTSSFFVSDFTEVDNNVTRHLQSELADESWDALILHYLGLDHIGHKGGPKSVYMAPKQAEMDAVLETLYKSRVADSDSMLLVLLGDHGMNDIGNHGGASTGETSPGLVLASPKFSSKDRRFGAPLERNDDFLYYSSMSQIDLVPTLAALFNFPIPKNNLGIILPEILELWSNDSSKRDVIFENCKQFVDILNEKYGETDATYNSLVGEFRYLSETRDVAMDSYYKFLKKVQSLLIAESTNYSYFNIICGLCFISISTIALWYGLFRSMLVAPTKGYEVQLFFALVCALYSLHFHGSSLIEEEHQIWWYMTVAVLFLHLLLSKFEALNSFAASVFFVRMIRAWNDSGRKTSSESTISKYLVSHLSLNWVLVVITYIFITIRISYEGYERGWSTIPFRSPGASRTNLLTRFTILSLISALSLSFKLEQFFVDGHSIPRWLKLFHQFIMRFLSNGVLSNKKDIQALNVQISRMLFISLLTVSVGQFTDFRMKGCRKFLFKNFVNVISLLLIHQTRLETIPIFIVFACLKTTYIGLLSKTKCCDLRTTVILLTLFILCLQNLSFFSVGNTNLLATVDLSNAYNGISEYGVVSVGCLALVSNFAVVIYWSLSAIELMANEISGSERRTDLWISISSRSQLTTAFYSISALSLVSSCLNLRFHLFIWSVFSPKLLYFNVWLIMVNVIFDTVLSYFTLYL